MYLFKYFIWYVNTFNSIVDICKPIILVSCSRKQYLRYNVSRIITRTNCMNDTRTSLYFVFTNAKKIVGASIQFGKIIKVFIWNDNNTI